MHISTCNFRPLTVNKEQSNKGPERNQKIKMVDFLGQCCQYFLPQKRQFHFPM